MDNAIAELESLRKCAERDEFARVNAVKHTANLQARLRQMR